MVQGEEEDVTLEEAPASKSSNSSTSGADLNLVKQLCSRLTVLGDQIAAEQQAHAQRTASLTNLVLELSELKSRSASITSDHSGEVTPTLLGQREHLAQSASIEDLLQLDGMRLSDDEPSPLMLKQYFSRQGSSSNTPSGTSNSGVIKHTSNYHPQESSGGQGKTSDGQWHSGTGNAQGMLADGHFLQAYHHRSSSLSTAQSTSSSSASSSSSSSSTSSTSATGPSATSFFKPGQPCAVDPTLCNFTQSPFFTELNMSGGNERNSGALSNYEAIWRPWGFNA